MGNPSKFSPLRFAILLSVSLTATSSQPTHSFFPKKKQIPPPPQQKPGKATTSDLLSVLGPTSQSSKVNPLISHQLLSCLHFLVPFTPSSNQPPTVQQTDGYRNCFVGPRRLLSVSDRRNDGVVLKGTGRRDEEDRMIWWPPEPVMELARLAFDSGGDVDVIHRALDPTVLPVPDVEESKENKCLLTRTPYGRRFISEELNSYLEFLFKLTVTRGPEIGLNITLNRYDFFHGHVFLAKETGGLGILFHAKEYPAYNKKVFPYNMGFCQTGSDVIYDDSMNLRNILWLAPLPSNSTKEWAAPGVLVVLDARPGGIIYQDLIPEYVQFARTIYEDDLGEVAVDVNYLKTGESNAIPIYQIFIC